MIRKLHVYNLGFGVDDRSLRSLFGDYGTVRRAEVVLYPNSRSSTGAGMVEMSSAEEAAKAIKALNGREYRGLPLRVEWWIRPEHGSETASGTSATEAAGEAMGNWENEGGSGSAGPYTRPPEHTPDTNRGTAHE